MQLTDFDDREGKDEKIDDEVDEDGPEKELAVVDVATALQSRTPKLGNRDAVEDCQKGLDMRVS